MTQEAKELAERLRIAGNSEFLKAQMGVRDACAQAADELDRLVAELEWIAKLPTRRVNGGIEVAYDVFNGGAAILRARAALQGSPPEAGTTGGRTGAG